jgi:hypothetical protein
MMRAWEEIIQLASTINFSGDQDEMIWTFSSNGVYSSQSLYKIVNFRGIKPIHTPAVWSLKIPPRVHFFLWLLTQNKTLTRDNVAKRKQVDDKSCLFFKENESIHHLFFDCVVARQVWANISKCLDLKCGDCSEFAGKMWLSNKKYMIVNIFTSAALWGLWKLSMFSGWPMERCELFTTKDSNTDLQLETPMSEIRARIKAKQAEMLSKTTGQIGKLAEPLKDCLLRFLEKHGSNREGQVPAEIAHLLADGRIDIVA